MDKPMFFVDTPVWVRAFFEHESTDRSLIFDGFRKDRKLVTNEMVVMEVRRALERLGVAHNHADDFVKNVVLECCLVLKNPSGEEVKKVKGSRKEDSPILVTTSAHKLPIITSHKERYKS